MRRGGEIQLPGQTPAKTACGHDSCGCAKALCCLECPLERCLTEGRQEKESARLQTRVVSRGELATE